MSLIYFTPSLVFSVAALGIAIDHYLIHKKKNDPAQLESCAVCCYLQPSDMANHEIWVISFLAVALSWGSAVLFFVNTGCSEL